MKRGRDDEKRIEPLFPRLHVNDADRGGPRAPPRNKMALYEQLSFPSQRFSHQGMLPPGPSNQACGTERSLRFFHHQLSSSTSMQPVLKFVARNSCAASMRSLACRDQKETAGEEDDFMVPVFLNSGRTQIHGRTKNGMGMGDEKLSPAATSSPRSVEIQETDLEDLENGSLSASSRQDGRGIMIISVDVVAREEINASKSESRNRLNQDDGETGAKGTTEISQSRGESQGRSSRDEVDDDRDRGFRSGRVSISSHGEASDGTSENSMVDSISSEDISSDDVVGIIGQKRFWKARRAIANQQRVFAVQVFELHRLVKVQRLIAASPHLLLDDATFPGKSSPLKKLILGEYIVKPLPCVAAKCKDDSKKDNRHKMECSAENVAGKTSGKDHKDESNPSPAAPAGTETNGNGNGNGSSWCFPPQPHQWLVPVMSPSEGLVYKPYPSPGLMGSSCGGYYNRFMPTPMAVSNFTGGGPVFGVPRFPVPPTYHQPGIRFSAFFPPFAMPTVNPNCSSHHMQQQSSCSFPTAHGQPQPQPHPHPHPHPRPRNGENSRVVQGSSGSGPDGSCGGVSAIPGNARPLFRAAVSSRGNEPLLPAAATRSMTRVIKVVPHNPKAASESAARIFRSIQEERTQQDSSV